VDFEGRGGTAPYVPVRRCCGSGGTVVGVIRIRPRFAVPLPVVFPIPLFVAVWRSYLRFPRPARSKSARYRSLYIYYQCVSVICFS
jgi:hypothetical protein